MKIYFGFENEICTLKIYKKIKFLKYWWTVEWKKYTFIAVNKGINKKSML